MDNRPKGRPKNVSGNGKDIFKRGDGLNTGGPVGRQDGYRRRREGYSSGSGTERGVTRAFGGKTLIIIVSAALLLGGGGLSGLFGNLFGGSGTSLGASGEAGGNSIFDYGASLFSGDSASSSGSGSSSGIDLTSLLGGFTGGGSASTGWDRANNTGKLDKTVAPGVRAKRTTIYGDSRDKVTIMVYMCGSDLESRSGMASKDLQEMANATLSQNVNILVYTGGCKSWRINGISSSVNQIYKVEKGSLTCLVKDDGKESLVKPSTLTNFIKYCVKNYPANRQALIFWDHGGGSLSGYGYDEKNASLGSMSLDGINTALKNAGTTFDWIGFDACLMATLETGLMLDAYSDYMVASEETEPGIGWYYTDWVSKLSANPSLPTVELGKQIVDDFVSTCNRSCNGQKATLSVVDLAELSATCPKALTSFASSTSQLISGSNYKTVSDARSATREFAVSSKIDQVDLVHLCSKIGTKEGGGPGTSFARRHQV